MTEELVGQTLGKYELIERIGRGGMAEVYKAYHVTLDRYVAIKVLHSFLGEDANFKLRFEREARNIAQLRHPNIVQVYDYDHEQNNDVYFMVMEFIDGPTLQTKLKKHEENRSCLDVSAALSIASTLADALSYAHQKHMIHRDLKPANIMFDNDGRVVLTDFGIAKIITGPNVTATGSMVGTPAYMAPELGMGKNGDHRSDIYSLGIVLFQMLTGSVPFNADTPIGIMMQHVNNPIPIPSSHNKAITPELEAILFRTLQKDPEKRYQDISDMIFDINQIISPQFSITGFRDEGLKRKPVKQKMKWRDKSFVEQEKSLALVITISLISFFIGIMLGLGGFK